MLLPIDMNFAARKVHFLQYEGPKFEPVGNFTVHLPFVRTLVKTGPHVLKSAVEFSSDTYF